jgi:hypothetical protein
VPIISPEDHRTTDEASVGDLENHTIPDRPLRPKVKEGDGEVPLTTAVQDRHRLGPCDSPEVSAPPWHLASTRIGDPQVGETWQRVFEERPVGLDENRFTPGACYQRALIAEVGAVDPGRRGRLDAGRERHEKGKGSEEASHRAASSASSLAPILIR